MEYSLFESFEIETKYIKIGLKSIFSFCLSILILRFISLTTLILISFIFASILGLIYLNIQEMKSHGIINYLPDTVRNFLIQRSIFDILMDIWYLPKFVDYLIMFFKPIIYKLSPEQAIRVLEDFDPSVRKLFITKGFLNLLPGGVKSWMLPEPDLKNEPNEIISGSTRIDLESEYFEVKSDSSNKPIVDEKCDCIINEHKVNFERDQKKVSILENEDQIKSLVKTDELLLINKNKLNIEKPSIIESNEKIKEFDYLEYDDPEKGIVKYKTRVIESSDKLKRKKDRNNRISINKMHNILKSTNIPFNKIKFEDLDISDCNCDLKTFYWDNLDAYYTTKVKEAIKDKTVSPMSPKLSFSKVLSEMIKNTIHSRVNYEKIGKYSMILLATFLIQMIINKKIRNWSFSLLNLLTFVISSAGLSGTMYFLLLKRTNNKLNDTKKETSTKYLNGVISKII